jgi:hypothetical protein
MKNSNGALDRFVEAKLTVFLPWPTGKCGWLVFDIDRDKSLEDTFSAFGFFGLSDA